MKKNNCVFAFLSLSIACMCANAVSHYVPSQDTVVDQFTGLEWERKVGEPMDYSAAEKYCHNLVLDGKKDWRVPTIEELATLPDRRKHGPAIDSIAFPNTQGELYWSSTSVVMGGSNLTRGIFFSFGHFGNWDLASHGLMRCVR